MQKFWQPYLLSSLLLAGCAQQPAEVVFLGERYYGNAQQVNYQQAQLTKPNAKVTSTHAALPTGTPTQKPVVVARKSPIITANLSAPPAPKTTAAPVLKLSTPKPAPIQATSTKPAPTPIAKASNSHEHVLQPGETLYRVSKQYNISLNDLITANDIKDVTNLPSGHTLKLPTATAMDSTVATATTNIAPTPLAIAPTIPTAKPNINAPEPMAKPALKTPEPIKQASLHPATQSMGKGFMWPLMDGDNHGVTAHFGKHGGGMYNDGMNISARDGAPVMAAQSGRVIYAGNELQGYGNLIIIRHADNYLTAYAHLKNISISRGDAVSKGATIGQVGSTGSVSKTQLHFGLRKGRDPVDPAKFLPKNPKWLASR